MYHGVNVDAAEEQRLDTIMGRTKAIVLGEDRELDWWSAEDIADITGDKPESIRRMLRYMRRPEHGAHKVDVKYLGNGYHLYRVNAAGTQEEA